MAIQKAHLSEIVKLHQRINKLEDRVNEMMGTLHLLWQRNTDLEDRLNSRQVGSVDILD